MSALNRILQVTALAALLLSFLLPALYYEDLPAKIPQHFNFAGKADIYGSKEIIWGIPLINLFLFALIAFASHKIKHNVQQPSYHQAPSYTERILWFTAAFICSFFAYICWATIRVALTQKEGIGTWPILIVLLLPIVLFLFSFVKWKGKRG